MCRSRTLAIASSALSKPAPHPHTPTVTALVADTLRELNGGSERTVACQVSTAVTRQNAQGARRRIVADPAVVSIWPVLTVRPMVISRLGLELRQSRW